MQGEHTVDAKPSTWTSWQRRVGTEKRGVGETPASAMYVQRSEPPSPAWVQATQPGPALPESRPAPVPPPLWARPLSSSLQDLNPPHVLRAVS